MPNPLRLGGARGPNGRTFDDLYNKLNDISEAMNTTRDATITSCDALLRLIGTNVPGNWQGLPVVMGYDSNGGGASVMQMLSQINYRSEQLAGGLNIGGANPWLEQTRTALQRLNDYIVGTGAVNIARGEDFYTALLALKTASDPAAIIAAINALRGAPVSSLSELFTVLGNIDASASEIAQVVGEIGIAPVGVTIKTLITELGNHIGTPTGDATTTLLGLLGSVQYALTQNPAAMSTLYSMIRAMTVSLTTPGNIDYTVLAELDALRKLSSAANAALIPGPPADMCATPFISNGIASGVAVTVAGITLSGKITVAVWPTSAPSGLSTSIDPILGNTGITAVDWSAWKVYVASNACAFGVFAVSTQRFNTNQWVVLSGGQEFLFYVDGNACLDVYICPVNAPPSTPLNDPDPELCSSVTGGPFRVTSYVPLPADQYAIPGQTAYALRFQDIGTQSGVTEYIPLAGEPDWTGVGNEFGASTWCLSWNLAGDNTPAAALSHRRALPWSTQDNVGTNQYFTASPLQGSNVEDVGANEAVGWVIILEDGQPLPGLNFWMKWSEGV